MCILSLRLENVSIHLFLDAAIHMHLLFAACLPLFGRSRVRGTERFCVGGIEGGNIKLMVLLTTHEERGKTWAESVSMATTMVLMREEERSEKQGSSVEGGWWILGER